MKEEFQLQPQCALAAIPRTREVVEPPAHQVRQQNQFVSYKMEMMPWLLHPNPQRENLLSIWQPLQQEMKETH